MGHSVSFLRVKPAVELLASVAAPPAHVSAQCSQFEGRPLVRQGLPLAALHGVGDAQQHLENGAVLCCRELVGGDHLPLAGLSWNKMGSSS
jgi:hypothetical protein